MLGKNTKPGHKSSTSEYKKVTSQSKTVTTESKKVILTFQCEKVTLHGPDWGRKTTRFEMIV